MSGVFTAPRSCSDYLDANLQVGGSFATGLLDFTSTVTTGFLDLESTFVAGLVLIAILRVLLDLLILARLLYITSGVIITLT
ncbi:hypothetical protein CRENBAI_002688 [Crenichthys baileyi]|uniref:Uncharacterized protein n=1 Tax=Crenichthys baileyi TaxID=28760 RepID=A0AAV9S8F0_9TELE